MGLAPVKRIDVIECFKDLKAGQMALCDAIVQTDAELPAWNVEAGHKGPINSVELLAIRQSIARHIGKLWYEKDEALRMPGLLACSEDTIALLQVLNLQKASFEKLMISLRKEIKAPGAKPAQLLGAADGKRDEDIDALLTDVGMKGLNLSLCYRRFHQLPDTIKSVSWTWSLRSRSIKRLSVEEAIVLANERLARKGSLQPALDKLYQLDADTPLAIVRPVQPALKANITFEDVEYRNTRKLITAHSPLFFRDNGKPLPRKNWPGYPDEANRPSRLARVQRSLENVPFIEALNLYCYLQ